MKATSHAVHILDAKYEKADINSVVNDMEHLSTTEKQQLKLYFSSTNICLMAHLENRTLTLFILN